MESKPSRIPDLNIHIVVSAEHFTGVQLQMEFYHNSKII